MGMLSDFLGSPVGQIGYGAAAEMYDQANIKAGDQQRLFQGLGDDLRVERSANNKMLNNKLSNFKSIELDFISNAKKYGEDESLPEDQLKLIFAPMAKYLKGDTFVGTSEEVQKKVAEALYQSGGITTGDPYTSATEFETKNQAAINKGLETYSGLAYNTWKNQVDDLTYKTPEYDMDAVATQGLKITAMNFPQWFPSNYGVDSPAMTVARMSILAENARVESVDDQGNFDPWKFAQLKEEKFNKIKDELNINNARALFDISESEFMKLVTSGSPGLSRLANVAAQLGTLPPGSPEYKALVAESGALINQHLSFLDDMKEGMFEKYVSKDSSLTKPLEQISMTLTNANFSGEGEAYKIHKQLNAVLANPESNIGISMPENFQANIIQGNEGRNKEQFTFVAVPQGMSTYAAKQGRDIPLNKKWLVVSNTGIVFELPSINALALLDSAGGDITKITKPNDLPATIADFDMPNAELKAHAAKAIKYAMEGKLKLNFVRKDNTGLFIQDNNYVKALENAAAFGKNTDTGLAIKYFGTKPVEGYGTNIEYVDPDLGDPSA